MIKGHPINSGNQLLITETAISLSNGLSLEPVSEDRFVSGSIPDRRALVSQECLKS